MLDFIGGLLVGLLEAAMPPRAASFVASLTFYLAALASFGAGAWVAYRAIAEPGERAYLGLALVAWVIALVFWFIAEQNRRA